MLEFLKKLSKIRPVKNLVQKSLDPFTYQKGSLLVFSLPITYLYSWIEFYYQTSFLGISLTFISVLVALMVIDFWTGLRASQKEGETVKSEKLAYTFFKFLSYFGFFLIVAEIDKMINYAINRESWFQPVFIQGSYMISFVRTFVFIILTAREFISIGENMERKFGKKPYIFVLVEKIAVQIELKLIRKIEQSDICPPEKKDDEKKG